MIPLKSKVKRQMVSCRGLEIDILTLPTYNEPKLLSKVDMLHIWVSIPTEQWEVAVTVKNPCPFTETTLHSSSQSEGACASDMNGSKTQTVQHKREYRSSFGSSISDGDINWKVIWKCNRQTLSMSCLKQPLYHFLPGRLRTWDVWTQHDSHFGTILYSWNSLYKLCEWLHNQADLCSYLAMIHFVPSFDRRRGHLVWSTTLFTTTTTTKVQINTA